MEENGYTPVTTPDQWKAIEERLKQFIVSVDFRFGDTMLTVQKVLIKENRYAFAVYINGSIEVKKSFLNEGETDFDPIVKLVWRRSEKPYFTDAWLKKHRVSKSMAKKFGYDKVFVSYLPDFPSAASLVRQLRKIENIAVEW